MKILVTFTGGTIGSTRSDGKISPDSASSSELLSTYNNIYGDEFSVAYPYSILSETLNGTHLTKLFDCINPNLDRGFDAIIVTHGTDTLQYTSAFLSYAFGFSEAPIILVSANYPLADSQTNGNANLEAAIDFAHSGNHQGVFVAYQNSGDTAKIHRASRVLPHSPYSDEVHSIFNRYYGKVENRRFAKNIAYTESECSKLCFNTTLSAESNVLYVLPYVGCSYPEIPENTKAILLGSYHSGTINTSSTSLTDFCKKAQGLNIPVFLTGDTDGFEYASKAEFKSLGIVTLPPASPTAMYMKLWMIKDVSAATKPFGGDF